ncbi:hypothetical protein GMDG_05633 [Pseudogymnoascus destructans 20631-21]|uniref:ATPase AAA-type core domain-containing protein n=2 Tax=Pseudogymnoascus destructans TaxID=655981 RepID=L8FQ76_PSED2|nr:hypothetical protein GMDG_05633 [Pseudogymnoascus destructans 20631-21]
MAVGKWSADVHSEIYVFDNSTWRKDRKLYLSVMGTKWSDVILSPSLKDGIITDITTFFDSEEMYTSLNIPWKRGTILHGTPGNGKTLSIKALINTLQTGERKIPSRTLRTSITARMARNTVFARSSVARAHWRRVYLSLKTSIRSYENPRVLPQ